MEGIEAAEGSSTARSREIIARATQTAAARGVTLAIEGGEGLRVEADQAALVLIVNNLVGNAFKYTNSGGRVEVTMTRLPGERAQVCVADTGIGMKAEEIGTDFVTLLPPNYFGSGLEIESEPGKGTRLRFALRLAPAAK